MAEITIGNQSAPATPSTGETTLYVDSVSKTLRSKDDVGVVTDYSNPGSSVTSLTGDVTGTGPGATATSIADTVVTGKVLTGLATGNGTVLSTDTILQALAKLNSRNNVGWFGNGVDGDVTITSDQTLVRDMYYNNLTINNGVVLTTASFRIHVLGSLINNGIIDRSGVSAISNAAAAALAAGSTGASGAGGAGGGVSAGVAGSATTVSIGTSAGGGGSGAGGAGGAAGAATPPTATLGGAEQMNSARSATWGRDLSANIMTGGSGGGGGGGSGIAGSGGGGGSGGGVVIIAARSLTGTGTIRANGGNGASAQLINAGGGGGGGGGAIALVTENDTTMTSLTIQVNGGTAGAGNGTGNSGANGSVGRIFRVRT